MEKTVTKDLTETELHIWSVSMDKKRVALCSVCGETKDDVYPYKIADSISVRVGELCIDCHTVLAEEGVKITYGNQ